MGKNLRDDRNSPFKAPNIQSLSQMGVSLVATLLTAPIGGIAGALVAAGIDEASSAAWTAADVSNGVISAQDGWGNFAKGAVTSLATAAVGSVFSGIAPVQGDTSFMSTGLNGMVGTGTDFGTLALKTGLAGVQAGTDQLISSSVNAVTFGPHGLGFNTDQFADSWNSPSAYAEIASSMATTMGSGLLNNTGKGFLGQDWSNYQKLGNFGGSLIGAGVSYAMTGDMKLNVLNVADLGLNKVDGQDFSYGLLEMNLGKDGFSMDVGSGGTNVSASAIANAAQGLGVWAKNAEIIAKAESLQTGPNAINEDLSAGLRSLSSSGNEKNAELFQSIMDGQTTFSDNPELNAVAQTVAAADGSKTISFGNQNLGHGEFDDSVILAHEAMRDGVDDGTAGQFNETADAVKNHLEMASMISATYGNNSLSGAITSEMSGVAGMSADQFQAYVGENYDSSGDDWKLTHNADGSAELRPDGRNGIYDDSDTLVGWNNSSTDAEVKDLRGLLSMHYSAYAEQKLQDLSASDPPSTLATDDQVLTNLHTTFGKNVGVDIFNDGGQNTISDANKSENINLVSSLIGCIMGDHDLQVLRFSYGLDMSAVQRGAIFSLSPIPIEMTGSIPLLANQNYNPQAGNSDPGPGTEVESALGVPKSILGAVENPTLTFMQNYKTPNPDGSINALSPTSVESESVEIPNATYNVGLLNIKNPVETVDAWSAAIAEVASILSNVSASTNLDTVLIYTKQVNGQKYYSFQAPITLGINNSITPAYSYLDDRQILKVYPNFIRDLCSGRIKPISKDN